MSSSQPENINLPAPPPEQAPGEPTAETLPAGPEQAASPTLPPLSLASPLPGPAPLSATPQSANPLAVPTGPAASVITDDDLIEKEWVNKAKRIVEQTRDDPYKQSENLTVFKADYLKQHYGKSIKLSQ
jgi:hypothetical protein